MEVNDSTSLYSNVDRKEGLLKLNINKRKLTKFLRDPTYHDEKL